MDLSMNKYRKDVSSKSKFMRSQDLSQNFKKGLCQKPSTSQIFKKDNIVMYNQNDISSTTFQIDNTDEEASLHLSNNENISYDGKEIYQNRTAFRSQSLVPHLPNNIEALDITLIDNDNSAERKQRFLAKTGNNINVHHLSDNHHNNTTKTLNVNGSNILVYTSDVNETQPANFSYQNRFINKNLESLSLKKRQLAAKAEELRIAEESIKKQEEEAQMKTWQALQEQEAALLEKEKALKLRGIAAKKKYEEAIKIIEESRKLSMSTENVSSSYENEYSEALKNKIPHTNLNTKNFDDNSYKRKLDAILPDAEVIELSSCKIAKTSSNFKLHSCRANGTMLRCNSPNNVIRTVDEKPPQNIRLLDIYGVKPSINPSNILHTYSRSVTKKFNSDIKPKNINSQNTLPQNTRILENCDKFSPKCVKEILISNNGSIIISDLPKSENPPTTLSTVCLSQPLHLKDKCTSDDTQAILSNNVSLNSSKTKIDIESNNNNLISRTKVFVDTSDLSCSDFEVALTEKVQKLTSRLHFHDQSADTHNYDSFSIMRKKEEIGLHDFSEDINEEDLTDNAAEVVPHQTFQSPEYLHDNSSIDFHINESRKNSSFDLYNNDNNNNELNNSNNNISQEETTLCNANSNYDLNEMSLDISFKDLIYKKENISDQINHSVEIDTNKFYLSSTKVDCQSEETSKISVDYEAQCYNYDTKVQNVLVRSEMFPNSENANLNEGFQVVNPIGSQKLDSIKENIDDSLNSHDKNLNQAISEDPILPEEPFSSTQIELDANSSYIIADHSLEFESESQKKNKDVNYEATNGNVNCISSNETNSLETLGMSSEPINCISSNETNSPETLEMSSEPLNIENEDSHSFNDVENNSLSDINELNIDDSSVIDANDFNAGKSKGFEENCFSDSNCSDEDLDYVNVSSAEQLASVIFKSKDKYYHPLHCAWKLTLDFRKMHYSEKLYPELQCHPMQWIEIEESEKQLFVSNFTTSPLFNLESKYSKNSSWEKMEYLSGKNLESGKLIFAGGPIKSSAWCPIPVCNSSQYIALSCANDLDYEAFKNKSEIQRGLIQIWEFEKGIETEPPKIALCIAHEYGVVRSMDWCPSGIYEKSETNKADSCTLNRLGLLAAGFSDGIIRIYLIPHPHQLESKKIIFKKTPEFSLIHYHHQNLNLQCIKICWSSFKGHSLIAGSFTNGMVCIWNLTCSSSILLSSDTEGIKLYPVNTISAHSGVCLAVSFYPKSEGNHIVTGGSDRTIKFWDLTQPEHPLTTIKKGFVTDSVWLPHWAGSVFSFDDAFTINKTASTFRGNGFYGNLFKSVAVTNATVWSISASDWLNAVVQGDEAGEVIISCPKSLNCISANESHISKNIFPIFSVRLERIKEIDSINEPKKNIKSLRGRKRVGRRCKNSYSKSIDSSSPQYVEEPITFSDAVETYRIKFYDEHANISKSAKMPVRSKVNPELLEAGPITVYPLMGASSVSWNNNLGTHTWIFVGLNSGFGRLIQIPFYKNC